MSGVYQGRNFWDSSGTVHFRKPRDATAFTEHGERTTMGCGANLPGSGLPANGHRLKDEHRDGNLCPDCLDDLRDRGVTIPGFMRDGELLNGRQVQPGTNRSRTSNGGIEE